MTVVGSLISCKKENVHEICLDVKPEPIPLREIISKFLGGQNTDMIGKPKFFFFVHDDAVNKNQVESDAIPTEEVK